MINANATVSIKDANDDFSNVTSVVDKFGRAVILQNEMPKYLVIELNSANDKDEYVSTEELDVANGNLGYEDCIRK